MIMHLRAYFIIIYSANAYLEDEVVIFPPQGVTSSSSRPEIF